MIVDKWLKRLKGKVISDCKWLFTAWWPLASRGRRMTGSAVPVLDVWTQKKKLFKERGVGRGVPRLPQVQRSADS